MSKDEDAAARDDARKRGQKATAEEQRQRDAGNGHPSGKSGGVTNSSKARPKKSDG